jgi:formylglycine-generating enzyme required for sulfatase activity
MVLIQIPAGTFVMGSPPFERGAYEDEQPQHEVTITTPFWLGKYEVTQAQYLAVMGNNPSTWVGPNHPVEMISWNDAQAFINKLNTLGLGVFRLPREAEWEYACRAGTTTRYYYGDALDCADRGGDPCPIADLYAWTWSNYTPGPGTNGTRDVGLKLPNRFGLHDMHGNVWEWCSDWYAPYRREPQSDPAGPATGMLKIIRGGMYRSNARMMRSAFRDHVWPSFLFSRIGLRVVRVD